MLNKYADAVGIDEINVSTDVYNHIPSKEPSNQMIDQNYD